MRNISALLTAVALFSVPAFAQQQDSGRVPQMSEPTTVYEALMGPVPNPIRNTPMGSQPLQAVPATPMRVEPSGTAALEQCQSRLIRVASSVVDWAPGDKKLEAIKELRAARIAILARNPRVCDAQLDQIGD